MEKFLSNVVADLIANYVSGYTWIVAGVIGVKLGWFFRRMREKKQTSKRREGNSTFNDCHFSFTSAPITIDQYSEKAPDIKGAVLKCDFQLAVMYVTGQGYIDTLAPQAYIEKIDGTRLPVEIRRVEVQDGIDKTRMFEIEPIPIEESSKD